MELPDILFGSFLFDESEISMKKTYGYVRVSTREQHEDRQLAALLDFGVKKKNIYMDKQSGKDFNRTAYQKLTRKRLKTDDLLVVKSIDRLGRDYKEILEEWRYITKILCANIVVLDMPLLDTRVEENLVGTFIADIVLQILSFVAQTERENTMQRQRGGIEAAKRRGVRFGRPPRPLPPEFAEAADKWRCKEITIHEALQLTGLPRSSFYAAVKKHFLKDKIENSSPKEQPMVDMQK